MSRGDAVDQIVLLVEEEFGVFGHLLNEIARSHPSSDGQDTGKQNGL